jgi:hypothetical protein
MVGILAFSLITLQQQFDQGDYRRAMEMIAAPQESWSIGRELMARCTGAAGPQGSPKLLSSFQGLVEVTCRTDEPEPYRFRVDLVRKVVSPVDDRSRELVEAVSRKRQQADASSPGPDR